MSTATVVSEPNIGLIIRERDPVNLEYPFDQLDDFLHRTIFSISAATTKHHLSTAVPSS